MPIIYRHETQPGLSRPPWLEGARPVAGIACDGWTYCHHPLLPEMAGVPDEHTRWLAVEDGWKVAVPEDRDELLGVIPALSRSQSRVDTLEVLDGRGTRWRAPRVFAFGGQEHAIRSSWEMDENARWQPSLTDEEQALIEAAETGRSALIAAGKGDDVPLAALVQRAATGLSFVNHISPMTLGRLGLIDETLALQTVVAMAGGPAPEGAEEEMAEAGS